VKITYRGLGTVRLARLLKGWTMRELGQRLTPPRSIAFVSRVENYGRATITREIAQDFAKVLESTVEELFVSK